MKEVKNKGIPEDDVRFDVDCIVCGYSAIYDFRHIGEASSIKVTSKCTKCGEYQIKRTQDLLSCPNCEVAGMIIKPHKETPKSTIESHR